MTDRLWRYQTLCTMVSNMHVSQNWIISSMYYNCHYISKKQVHIRTCAEHNHTGNDDQNTHWKMSGIDYPADWGWQHRQPFTCKAGCFHLAALKLNVPSHVRILRRVRKAFARKMGEMAALSFLKKLKSICLQPCLIELWYNPRLKKSWEQLLPCESAWPAADALCPSHSHSRTTLCLCNREVEKGYKET